MAKYLDSTGLQHVYSVFKTKFSALFAPKSHTHDDRYYTESEINSKLSGKSDTSHNHDSRYLKLSGGTMTGQVLTSFKSAVATGSLQASSETIPNLLNELRYSSGCMGSFNLNTAYTANSVTIATGWYTFLYIPHRSGGVSGSASGDNCNYGVLLLFGMTKGFDKLYEITYSNSAVGALTEKVNSTDSRLSNARPASDVYSWAKASSKPSYSKSEVGLGNVANINQSKAIKSITRSGTTFTATALDGTTSTFTQQDNNTTYGVVSTTANGLAPKRDGSTAHFLRGDGTWATPPNTTYTMATNAQIDSLF